MTVITPIFDGSYSGQMIYNNTNFLVGDSFKKHIESVELAYDAINKIDGTGFEDTGYLQNAVDSINSTGSIAITLVGDLPKETMEQLHQLAKACIGGGMSLSYYDIGSDNTFKCKWENAGDFVENDELLCGGTMLLRFYEV